MTRYHRDRVACHLCFLDKVLQEWVKEKAGKAGVCPWCGKRGCLVPLELLAEPFREVVENLYIQADGPDAYERGDLISSLLDDDWRIFSDQIRWDGLAQKLAVSILYAGLREKERFDYPDYCGLFVHEQSLLEDAWDEKAYAASKADEIQAFDERRAADLEGGTGYKPPDRISIAFEDLAVALEEGTILYRARVHRDRTRTARFKARELGAPPPELATAGRVNRKGEPVLYLASNKSTAIAEVRPWKGSSVAVAQVRLQRRMLLVDLTRSKPFGSPFFVELLRWKLHLRGLLGRLADDMARPVAPHEGEFLYKPTQYLAQLMQSNGYDGCKYPSAMGSGTNIVLFEPKNAKVMDTITYVRVSQIAYFSKSLSPCEDPYEEGPYDYMLPSE